jgi:hypothetical protein
MKLKLALPCLFFALLTCQTMPENKIQDVDHHELVEEASSKYIVAYSDSSFQLVDTVYSNSTCKYFVEYDDFHRPIFQLIQAENGQEEVITETNKASFFYHQNDSAFYVYKALLIGDIDSLIIHKYANQKLTKFAVKADHYLNFEFLHESSDSIKCAFYQLVSSQN